MKNLILLLTLQLAVSFIRAQGINQEDLLPANIIEASPNAASLGEYGQYPVGKFTGIPNINIPLYTIQDGDIQVPISISYHAGGYKPGEDASLVGHGWSLNAGGAITRSVNGQPDENEYFKNMAQLKDWEEQGYLWTKGKINCEDETHPESVICVPESIRDDRHNFLLRNPDTQADLFVYNFPGGTGKFQFGENKQILMFPYSDIKIETDMVVSNALNGGIIKSFDLKSGNGLSYHFGTPEETSVFNLSFDEVITEPYVSAWYLNRIYSKISNNYIVFAYSSINGLNKYPLESESYSHYYSFLNQQTASTWTTTAVRVHLQERLLKRITWSKGYIELMHSERNDIAGGEKLDKILIYNYENQLIKSYQFTYSYFIGSGNLRLDEVVEVDATGGLKEPHVFDYNDGTPDNHTKAIDHYGFFNGANNSTTIPYTFNYWRVKTKYADREMKPNFPKVGMLTSIVYPTKGKTEFEYENNQSFGRVYNSIKNLVISEYCDENGGLYVDESGNTVQGLVCDSNKEIEFTIADPINTLNGFNIEIYGRTSSGTQISHGDMYVLLREKDAGISKVIKRFDVLNNSVNTYNNVLDGFEIIPGKTYLLNAVTDLEGSTLTANFTYGEGMMSNYLAPGIRIKEIKNFDNYDHSIPVKIKKYFYGTEGNNDLSSGVFYHKEPKYHFEYDDSQERTFHNVSVSNPRNTKGQFAAPVVYYKQVEEKHDGNGETREYYSYFQNLEPISLTMPDNKVPTSEFWKIGQLEKKIIFKENGDILKKVKNNYSYIKLDTSRSFIYQKWFESADPNTHIIKWAFNYQVSGFERLSSSKTVTYVDQDSLVSQQNYFYKDDNTLLLPIAQETIDAGGNKKRLETQYLNNRDEHVISPVLNQKSYEQGALIQDLTQSLSGFKPSRKVLTNANGETIQDIEINYQNGLNISRISDNTGKPKSYTWAYNETLPIIENIGSIITIPSINSSNLLPGSYQTIAALLADLDDIANDPIAQDNWAQFNSNIRAHYNSLIKTYTYKPLVGMTSFTDENGQTTYYEYDGFGRLVRMKDHDNNIIKLNHYSLRK